MKSIQKLLTDHFDEYKSSEIASILNKYGLMQVLDNTVQLLRKRGNKINDVVAILSVMLIGTEQKIDLIKKIKCREKAVELISVYTFVFLGDFFNKTHYEPNEIIRDIKKNLLVFKDIFNTAPGRSYKLFDFEKLAFMYSAREKNRIINDSGERMEYNKRFIWTNKGKLEELVHQLLQRKLIRNKSSLFNLFLKPDENLLVKWDDERKAELALLLYKLYSLGFIKISVNKGYFSLAEKHFCGFTGTVFKRNSLKKLSSSIRTENEKYSAVITEVNAIINSIQQQH